MSPLAEEDSPRRSPPSRDAAYDCGDYAAAAGGPGRTTNSHKDLAKRLAETGGAGAGGPDRLTASTT